MNENVKKNKKYVNPSLVLTVIRRQDTYTPEQHNVIICQYRHTHICELQMVSEQQRSVVCYYLAYTGAGWIYNNKLEC